MKAKSLITVLLVFTSLVFGQNKSLNNDQIYQGRKNILTETVRKTSPAVVGITVYETQRVQDPFMGMWNDDPFFKQFFGDRSYNREVKSLGSGFIISEDGYIVTNDHVAGNGQKIIVTLTTGEEFTAKKIGSDLATDICLLKIEGEHDFPYLKFGNSEDIIIAEWVIALGNPFGLFELNDQPTVSVGVISATGQNLDPVNGRYYTNMIQTDAAINGGNSGGPLVNSLGEVIGINTLIYSPNGAGNIGIGFAIPSNKVKSIIEDLKANKKIDRSFWTGLNVQMIDEGIAKSLGLKTKRGVIINDVKSDSPAEKAGLQVGDVILEVEGFKISTDQHLISLFQEFRVGQKIVFKILRENKTQTVKMYLTKKEGN